MPEMPDVEQCRKFVQSRALHKKISHIEVLNDKVLSSGTHPTSLNRSLNGKLFKSALRHGKHLILSTGENVCMNMHFGMTGCLRYEKETESTQSYDKLVVVFSNRDRLVYVSKRMLGRVGLCKTLSSFLSEHKLGPDALSISEDEFIGFLSKKKTSVKQALMDQSRIAGIGNEYSDEILFQARLHPLKIAADLSEEEKHTLYYKMGEVLNFSIQNDAQSSRFPENWILKFRKSGAKCGGCGGKVEQIKVSGRTAYFCPKCQKQK
ncbi:Formamidopyrimidine-DNA glycosylase [Chitinispirillum alkaliphilum]|nr:Formamidopyrimidine-DNA glycosylase [Chitinispirillum alkaliphilum]